MIHNAETQFNFFMSLHTEYRQVGLAGHNFTTHKAHLFCKCVYQPLIPHNMIHWSSPKAFLYSGSFQ